MIGRVWVVDRTAFILNSLVWANDSCPFNCALLIYLQLLAYVREKRENRTDSFSGERLENCSFSSWAKIAT